MVDRSRQKEVQLYVSQANEMLRVAKSNIEQNFYTSAINRAYYAVFYAASALLSTKGIARRKHSSVLSEFRRNFVKTGLFAAEHSDFYGQILDDRQAVDYDLLHSVTFEETQENLASAEKFVTTVETWLIENGWI